MPVALALALILPGTAHSAGDKWKQFEIKDSVKINLPDGTKRELSPSCSGGPVVVNGDIVAADTQYSFFLSKGDSKKILLALDGGGGCWDTATCLASPLDPGSFGGRPTYTPAVDETTESVAAIGGVLDSDNSANPFRDYTKVYIPYCTGDIHWGSRDTTYFLPDIGPWTIRHRGADNLLAVLDSLRQEGINLKNASDISVVGASAGAYGANFAFAAVAERAGDETALSLVADSGIGVIDNPLPEPLDFYETAIYEASGGDSWGVAQNVPEAVYAGNGFATAEDYLEHQAGSPNSLMPSILFALSRLPNARVATVTPNVDGVQIGFYGLMNALNQPSRPLSEFQAAAEWFCSMAAMTTGTAAVSPGYSYFIEGGNFHTFIFGDVFGQLEDDPFYARGASGYILSEWTEQLIDPDRPLPTPVLARSGLEAFCSQG